jgi:cytoskeletal protein CcmA (bactofilin family)
MSGTTDIYVTPSTSLVLLKNLSSITNVYLRAFAVPSFSVTIRDTTGLSSLTTQPVRISTVDSARFSDGGNLYLLNQPYGLVNVSLRTSNVWQINHTSGQIPATAAATVQTLSANQVYLSLQSTVQKFTSTLVVESLTTPNSISITGPFIVSNLSTPGFVLFEQNLNVYGTALMRNTLEVIRNTVIVSSFRTVDLLPVGLPVIVYSSMGVAGNLSVGQSLIVKSTLTLRSTLQVDSLQVKFSSLTRSTDITGDLGVAQSVSSLGGFLVGGTLTVGGNVLLRNEALVEGLLSTSALQVGDSLRVLGNITTTSFATIGSTLHTNSTLIGNTSFQFMSSFGGAGLMYTSSLSTLQFSTLGFLTTSRLEVLSSASVDGSMSTSFFRTFSSMTVGNDLFTPATISSLNQARFFSPASVNGTVIAVNARTSSLGIAGDLSVAGTASSSNAVALGDGFIGTSLFLKGNLEVAGSLGVRSTVTVYGNLEVKGGAVISSFIVNSFLLGSSLQITTSSPFISFTASTLIASTVRTSMSRIFRDTPYTVSSVFASTTNGRLVESKVGYFSTLLTDSFYAGTISALAEDSKPTFALNVKTQFTEGLSTLTVNASETVASFAEGALFGRVNYLSNVAIPFSNISGITLTLSTLATDHLFGSSFQASTFTNFQFLQIQSSLITSNLRMDAQGFQPDWTTNQLLNVSPSGLAVNRKLYFQRTPNKIGLFVPNPTVDFDVSGLVYASNIMYSSINPLIVKAEGTVVLSTVYVSSSFVRDSLQYGGLGVRIKSQTAASNFFFVDNAPYLEINNFGGYESNLMGLYNGVTQSSVFLNTGVGIHRTQKVTVNPFSLIGKDFLEPSFDLNVYTVLHATDTFVSTATLSDTIQATTLLSPFMDINPSVPRDYNRISTAYERVFFDQIMTVETGIQASQRNVGVFTSNPECALDVRGNAYFSTGMATDLRINYLAIAPREI